MHSVAGQGGEALSAKPHFKISAVWKFHQPPAGLSAAEATNILASSWQLPAPKWALPACLRSELAYQPATSYLRASRSPGRRTCVRISPAAGNNSPIEVIIGGNSINAWTLEETTHFN